MNEHPAFVLDVGAKEIVSEMKWDTLSMSWILANLDLWKAIDDLIPIISRDL